MKKVFLLASICLVHTILWAQQSLYKERVTQSIYTTITKASGDLRLPPSLVFDYKTGKKTCLEAYFNPDNKSIHVGEGIYDLCVSLQQDSANAMAFVLAHELAHYYKDHGWGISFGTLLDDPELLKTISSTSLSLEKKIECEGQADYFGLMYTYLAGYSAFAASRSFLEKLYTAKGIKNSVQGYPDKSSRLIILTTSRNDLNQLIPLFEAANLLQLTGEYESAGVCYQKIAEKYPSKEIFNNAGVNYAKAALQLYTYNELPYLLPFGFEVNSSLYATGTKGVNPHTPLSSKEEIKKKLLSNAKAMFEKALQVDDSYTLATIHLGLILFLDGKKPLANGYLTTGLELAQKENNSLLVANTLIAQGILFALNGQTNEAKTKFTEAQKGNYEMAIINQCALANKPSTLPYQSPVGQDLMIPQEAEYVPDISLSEKSFSKPTRISLASGDNEFLKLSITYEQKKDFTLLDIKIATYQNLNTLHYINTTEYYARPTLRGIKKNDSKELLLQKYGSPGAFIPFAGGIFYKYDEAGIIFKLNEQHKIISWTIFN